MPHLSDRCRGYRRIIGISCFPPRYMKTHLINVLISFIFLLQPTTATSTSSNGCMRTEPKVARRMRWTGRPFTVTSRSSTGCIKIERMTCVTGAIRIFMRLELKKKMSEFAEVYGRNLLPRTPFENKNYGFIKFSRVLKKRAENPRVHGWCQGDSSHRRSRTAFLPRKTHRLQINSKTYWHDRCLSLKCNRHTHSANMCMTKILLLR